MYSLTYVSSATVPFSPSSLRELLEKSRSNNLKRGITGMLLFKDGNFMQVLEGEQAAVDATQQRIDSDPRHTGLIVLLRGEIAERSFAEWSMAFQDLNDESSRQTPGYSDFLITPLNDPRFRNDPEASRKLIAVFKRNLSR